MTNGEIKDIIQTALTGLGYTVEQRFQLHDEEFEEFSKFPLVVIADGTQINDRQANKTEERSYSPQIVFFAENQTSSEMDAHREAIESAFYESSALNQATTTRNIDSITPSETETRKLEKLTFEATIDYDVFITLS